MRWAVAGGKSGRRLHLVPTFAKPAKVGQPPSLRKERLLGTTIEQGDYAFLAVC